MFFPSMENNIGFISIQSDYYSDNLSPVFFVSFITSVPPSSSNDKDDLSSFNVKLATLLRASRIVLSVSISGHAIMVEII